MKKKIYINAGIDILRKSIEEFKNSKDNLSMFAVEREKADIRGQASMLYWINAITYEEFEAYMDEIEG